jgi:hypothetical protein
MDAGFLEFGFPQKARPPRALDFLLMVFPLSDFPPRA